MRRRQPRRGDDDHAPEIPTPSQTRIAALRLLGRRDYTAAEARLRLIDRGHDPAVADTVVAALVADGSIDDRRTAFAHVRTASRLKARGPLRIRRELEARGVAADLAREALGEATADDDLSAIRRLIARARLSPDSPAADRRRVFQQLLRRGFPADTIAKAIRLREDE